MESQTVEYKRSWRDDWLSTLCAFANSDGGILWLGINDDGSVEGIDSIKRLLDDIPAKTNNHLGVVTQVNHENRDGKDILSIHLSPSSVPISYKGRFYARIGSTTHLLQGSQLADFLANKSGKGWLDASEPKASLDDIDPDSIQRFKDLALGRMPSVKDEGDIESLLEKLDLLDNGHLIRAAVLLFGKQPGRFFSSSFTQVGLFLSDSNVVQTDRYEGNLIQQAEQVVQGLIGKYIGHQHEFKGIQRLDHLHYPETALREMVMNAIVHRDYTGAHTQIRVYPDHINCWNDGGLPFGVLLDSLKGKHKSKPRNPLVARTFFRAGMIETWGRGTNTMVESCVASGLPEPEFEEISGGFQVILRKDRLSDSFIKSLGLNDRQAQAIEFLKTHVEITNSKYQELFNVARNTATRDIQALLEKGVVNQIGTHGVGVKYMLKP